MADIDIQEKRRSAWPWIIGLLGLVLVVWVAAEMLGGPDDEYVASDVTAEEIRELFCAYGIVEHISLIKNRDTGCLCGFGFVAMQSGANEAIAATWNMPADLP